jgi:hypothetical protein
MVKLRRIRLTVLGRLKGGIDLSTGFQVAKRSAIHPRAPLPPDS